MKSSQKLYTLDVNGSVPVLKLSKQVTSLKFCKEAVYFGHKTTAYNVRLRTMSDCVHCTTSYNVYCMIDTMRLVFGLSTSSELIN